MVFAGEVAGITEKASSERCAMRLMTCIIMMCVMAMSATVLAQGPSEKAKSAWRDLFAQSQPAAVSRAVSAVLAACGNDAEMVKAFITSDTEYKAFDSGWGIGKTSVGEIVSPF